VSRLAERWDALAPRLSALGFTGAGYDPEGYRRGGADRPVGETAREVEEEPAAELMAAAV
jgi:hypothetical protein